MEKKKQDNNLLLMYAGLAFQMLAAIGIALYAGIMLDKWIKSSVPVFLWLLPLIVIIGMIIKAIKDTSKKQDG